jgi:hypothetical protein
MEMLDKFSTQKELVETADAFGQLGEFEAELAKMEALQNDIAARLMAARLVAAELEPIVESSDWRRMTAWVKRYGRNTGPAKEDKMLDKVQNQIAQTIRANTGATVDITFTSATEFTVSGNLDDTQIAAQYLYEHNLAVVESSVFDAECGNFIYMRSVQ